MVLAVYVSTIISTILEIVWSFLILFIGPNGGDECKYKHSLPPGFVLKTKEQRAAEKALMDKSPLATLTLEDFLEARR